MSKESEKRPIIEPQKDGPLKVTGLREFRNSRGEKIAAKQTVFLCRCGASKRKPFCDGSHAAVGFTDDRSDDRVPDRLDRYEGRELIVRDNRGQCAHAGFCTSGLPQVWRMGVEPWVDPDGASTMPSAAVGNPATSRSATVVTGMRPSRTRKAAPFPRQRGPRTMGQRVGSVSAKPASSPKGRFEH